jgi:light-harvesting complex 1 alpha chain
MWKIWLILDPRRTLIAVLVFAFSMVMLNHFVQLSSERYGSWLNGPTVHSATQAAPLPSSSK